MKKYIYIYIYTHVNYRDYGAPTDQGWSDLEHTSTKIKLTLEKRS